MAAEGGNHMICILHTQDSREWASYVSGIFDQYAEVTKTAEDVTTLPTNQFTCSNIRQSIVKVVILSPQLMSNCCSELNEICGPDCVGLICGIELPELDNLRKNLTNFRQWKTLTCYDADLQTSLVSSVFKVHDKVLEGKQQAAASSINEEVMEDIYVIPEQEQEEDIESSLQPIEETEDIYEDMTVNSPEAEGGEELYMDMIGEEPEGDSPPNQPPPAIPKTKGKKPAKKRERPALTIFPSRVIVGEETDLLLVLSSKLALSPSSISCEVIFKRDKKTTRVEGDIINKYNLLVRSPKDHSPGVSDVIVIAEGKEIAKCKMEFLSGLDQISKLLKKEMNPIGLICQAFNISPGDSKTLDQVLTESFQQNVPKGFSMIAPLKAGHLDTVNRESEIPTLIHLAAQYDLRDFCSHLTLTPGSAYALGTANKNGCYPQDIARQKGFPEMEGFLNNFLETVALLEDAQIYESMESGNKQDNEDDSDYEFMMDDIPGNSYYNFMAASMARYQKPFDVAIQAAGSAKYQNKDMIKQFFESGSPEDMELLYTEYVAPGDLDSLPGRVTHGDDDIYQVPPSNEEIYQAPTNNEDIYQAPTSNEEIYQVPTSNEDIYQAPTSNEEIYQVPSTNEEIYQAPTSNEEICQVLPDEEIYQAPTSNEQVFCSPNSPQAAIIPDESSQDAAFDLEPISHKQKEPEKPEKPVPKQAMPAPVPPHDQDKPKSASMQMTPELQELVDVQKKVRDGKLTVEEALLLVEEMKITQKFQFSFDNQCKKMQQAHSSLKAHVDKVRSTSKEEPKGRFATFLKKMRGGKGDKHCKKDSSDKGKQKIDNPQPASSQPEPEDPETRLSPFPIRGRTASSSSSASSRASIRSNMSVDSSYGTSSEEPAGAAAAVPGVPHHRGSPVFKRRSRRQDKNLTQQKRLSGLLDPNDETVNDNLPPPVPERENPKDGRTRRQSQPARPRELVSPGPSSPVHIRKISQPEGPTPPPISPRPQAQCRTPRPQVQRRTKSDLPSTPMVQTSLDPDEEIYALNLPDEPPPPPPPSPFKSTYSSSNVLEPTSGPPPPVRPRSPSVPILPVMDELRHRLQNIPESDRAQKPQVKPRPR